MRKKPLFQDSYLEKMRVSASGRRWRVRLTKQRST
jgi:hypothetical protein